MALATPQEPAQMRMSPFVDNLSHAAASMGAVFPHQNLLYHSSCKKASSATPAALPFRTVDCCSSFDTEDDYEFENNSQPLLLQYELVESIGAGLANLGNTCFLNSVLQCLTYTPPLAAHFRAGLHSRSCNGKGFCAMCAMERHVREALSSGGRIVSPNYLVKNLRCISRSFQLWRQEDSHEYMRYLIEAFQRCCSVELLGGESFVKGVFGGRLRSQVKCTRCSHCSNKYDPFLDLSLEVNRADSLNKALAHFTAIEVLDGDNKYQCSKCKTKVRALKQFAIDRVPPILTIQLKRFSSSGSYGGKIDKKVHFERDLDLTPFVTGSEDEMLGYSLYAVLVHSGWSTHSGHYYCFVRTATDTWHAMDDSEVSQVSESTVLAQKAYILFYIRNVRSTISSEASFLKENIIDNDLHQQISSKIEISENNGSGFAAAAEQTVTCSTLYDHSSEAASMELQKELPILKVSEIDEVNHALSSTEKTSSFNFVKCMKAESLNGDIEESWYRAVQIINNLSVDISSCEGTEAGGLLCSLHVAKVQAEKCASEQTVCTDDSSGVVRTATLSSHFDGDANPGADGDEFSMQESCQLRCHSLFNFVSPILRTARFEAAGQQALSFLCMCAKFCFWSCFWPPV